MREKLHKMVDELDGRGVRIACAFLSGYLRNEKS